MSLMVSPNEEARNGFCNIALGRFDGDFGHVDPAFCSTNSVRPQPRLCRECHLSSWINVSPLEHLCSGRHDSCPSRF